MVKNLNEYIDFSNKINQYISRIMIDNGINFEEYSYSQVWESVQSLGVVIRGFNFEGIASKQISGMLVQDNLETTIVYNQRLDDKNKNFAISREIIHYLFHRDEINNMFVDMQKKVDHSYYKDLCEFQADIGASAILIPDCVLIHFLKKGWNLTQLSDHFGISESKLYVRLIQMMQSNLGMSITASKKLAHDIQFGFYGRGKAAGHALAADLECCLKEADLIPIF
ncbi:ImmA/IrrE family metallo-endopeptidase [Candidatus Enterococcus ikei]|uniref:ImmA/IrrE family metallo-endopeptidase n=1 Tax=Candidatus Enterococcus ikei TaxID=2815326 RepID=A0ABS3H299_9ENTE|nr:ImmA/IrrE family metallo-endopeptidase [Enterococcus sp. DIV0869a]MBO0441662.1 ImmA/IrrE family metallo-endopeptidase [Enterococcus sp. DIV0869a]